MKKAQFRSGSEGGGGTENSAVAVGFSHIAIGGNGVDEGGEQGLLTKKPNLWGGKGKAPILDIIRVKDKATRNKKKCSRDSGTWGRGKSCKVEGGWWKEGGEGVHSEKQNQRSRKA